VLNRGWIRLIVAGPRRHDRVAARKAHRRAVAGTTRSLPRSNRFPITRYRGGGSLPRSVFQNVRITADTANNSVVVYSNQEDYRTIEEALRDLDRPRLQVAIDATVAEVTLTDNLQYGVQWFLTSKNARLGNDNGSVGLFGAGQSAAQSALLQRVTPGLNVLIGSEALPRVTLNALSTLTDVKVLSSPSVVALDNQPALLQVGDEIPITTSSATLLSNFSAPMVNTVEMRNTGVILKVLPHVNANGTIQLEIDQEISNVVNPDQQTLTPTGPFHGWVTSGQTVLLAGLISEPDQRSRSGVPGLSNIGFLGGGLFGDTTGPGSVRRSSSSTHAWYEQHRCRRRDRGIPR
jgi:general secretion pathway protein D